MRGSLFQVENRRSFDEFWLRGVQLWRFDRSRTTSATEPDRGRLRAPEVELEPPIDPQVWWHYGTRRAGDDVVDLLIDPGPVGFEEKARRVHSHVIDGEITDQATQWVKNQYDLVALKLDYATMVQRLLPLTPWGELLREATSMTQATRSEAMRLAAGQTTSAAVLKSVGDAPHMRLQGWFLLLLVVCLPNGEAASMEVGYSRTSRAMKALDTLLAGVRLATETATAAAALDVMTPTIEGIGRVTLNREVRTSGFRSVRTVKADAARDLFGVSCRNIRWAVVDTGIDARHRAFRRPRDPNRPEAGDFEHPFENDIDGQPKTFNYTRIISAYDFTKLRTTASAYGQRERTKAQRADGSLPGDVPITLDVGERFYVPPQDGHGTHIAGIIGGSEGICPDIELIDYRVLDATGGTEFVVVSALRHILEVTRTRADPRDRSRDLPIHGVNLSLALDVDVTKDACGWSLICRVCDELVRAGVVVVVSAGNTGFEAGTEERYSTGQNYRTVSITDPGNTESAITVGATDTDRPREYGVSYFSARGPTADGRLKPDLVAPGLAIRSAFGYVVDGDDRRDEYATLDGTSQAAAHVSGCAAMLMARHAELIGKPAEVKRILVETATDLGRDRSFQGAGLVDALRAVQSI